MVDHIIAFLIGLFIGFLPEIANKFCEFSDYIIYKIFKREKENVQDWWTYKEVYKK